MFVLHLERVEASSLDSFHETDTGHLYRCVREYRRFRSDQGPQFVVLEVEPSDLVDPGDDPVVAALSDCDEGKTVRLLWRGQVWKLAQENTMKFLAILGGVEIPFADDVGAWLRMQDEHSQSNGGSDQG
jgi:hypothetical protein